MPTAITPLGGYIQDLKRRIKELEQERHSWREEALESRGEKESLRTEIHLLEQQVTKVKDLADYVGWTIPYKTLYIQALEAFRTEREKVTTERIQFKDAGEILELREKVATLEKDRCALLVPGKDCVQTQSCDGKVRELKEKVAALEKSLKAYQGYIRGARWW